jgi:hypothetical protein
MKKIITLTFILCSFLTFAQKKEKVKGSKIVKMEQKEVENFQNLEVEDNLEIFLVKGNECAIEIEADDNLIEYVEYKSVGNTLKLSTSRDITSSKKLSVRVTYTDDFKMVIAKNETNITALSDITIDNITFKTYDYAKLFLNAKTKMFTLMANDKSKVELNLKSEKTTIDLSKSAQLKALISSTSMKFDLYQKSKGDIEGDIIDLDLTIDNNAYLDGEKFIAKNAEIKAEGFSTAKIMVATKVIINASGKSEIQLYGEPKIELKRFTESAVLTKKPSK